MFVSLFIMRFVYFRLDAFGESINFGYHYNHILCLFASVALFYAVKHWQLKDGTVSRLIGKVAPYTFGVYLLHEHILVRYEWVKWLKVTPTENMVLFLAALIWKCLLVLVAGIVLDWLRSLVFKAVVKMLQGSAPAEKIRQMDQILRGETKNSR